MAVRLIEDIIQDQRIERLFDLKRRSPTRGCVDEIVLRCFRLDDKRAFEFGNCDSHGVFYSYCTAHIDMEHQDDVIWIGWYGHHAFRLSLHRDIEWKWNFIELRDGKDKREVSLHVNCND